MIRVFFKYFSKSPLDAYSNTMWNCMNTSIANTQGSHYVTVCRTGVPTVTTPCSAMTLGCQNWPMMAASCRNLIGLLSWTHFFLSVFTATNMDSPSHTHRPLQMLAEKPEPICSSNLCIHYDSYRLTVRERERECV